MDMQLLLIALACFFLAALLKGMAGIGFATSCLGAMACFVDIKLAIPLVIIPSLVSNVIVIVDSGKTRAAMRRFWPMYLTMICGMFIGLWLLGTVESASARFVLGMVMASYASWALLNPGYLIPERFRQPMSLPVGLATGVVNGLTGSQIMPALPYLFVIDIDKNLLVAAINISFTIGSLIMLAGLSRMHLLTSDTFWIGLLGIPLVFAGVWLGSRIRRRASEAFFKRMVLLLILIMGFNLMLRG